MSAQITHTLEYNYKPARMLYWAGLFTHPAWGLVMPLTAVINVCVALSVIIAQDWDNMARVLVGFGSCFYALSVFLLGGFVTGASNEKLIEVDSTGICLPFYLTFKNRRQKFIAWHEIKSIKLVDKRYLFITSQDGVVNLDLSNMSMSDQEQLIISLSLLSPEQAVDVSILEKKDELAEALSQTDRLLSFTALWDDEMASRFSSTAYVPLFPAQTIQDGRFTVIRQLNLGGWAAVYLVSEEGNRLRVAKEAVIPVGSSEELKAKALSMFERETQLLMRIQHPNIVKVHDHFVDQDRQYIILDYLSGENLRKHIQLSGRMHELDVLEWAETITGMLDYLHQLEPPLVHRDLTPDNIILDADGILHLIDFGAANELIGTATGTMVGKQSYMAPEQFRGKATTRSDLYSLGATIAFLLTGKDPEPMTQIDINEQTNLKIRPAFNQIIKSLTDLDEEKRTQSAAQALNQMRALYINQSLLIGLSNSP